MKTYALPFSLSVLSIFLLVSCATRLAPDSLHLPDLARKSLSTYENKDNLSTWFNRLGEAKRKGFINDEDLELSKSKLLDAYGAQVQGEGFALEDRDTTNARLLRVKAARNLRYVRDNLAVPQAYELRSSALVGSGSLERKNLLEDATNHELNATISKPADSLKAAVTIWVDKGTRNVQGLGIPDRVVGSGFFISKDGYILTNYHVISSEVDTKYLGYSKLYIKTSEHPEVKVPASVISWDPIFDLALLKTSIEVPAFISLANRSSPKQGDEVFALGSPGGLENTITRGIVSSLSRRMLAIGEVLQVDAAINPGNSGGALLDSNGRLAGIVFAGIERFEGVNFAIPAESIVKLMPQLLGEGEVALPWLGVQVYEDRGVLRVAWVLPGSPAALAGIEASDVLLSLENQNVSNLRQAEDILLQYTADQIISLRYRKGQGDYENLAAGDEVTSLLALEKRKGEFILPFAKAGFHQNLMVPLFGFSTSNLEKSLVNLNFAVREVLPGTYADELGFSKGDVLSLLGFGVYEDTEYEQRWIYLQIEIKKKNAAFAPSTVQLLASSEMERFL